MTSAEEKYKDIIYMERPWDQETLCRHPRMDLTQRAKIFSPFSAVRGSDEKAKDEEAKLMRVMRRELSEDDIRDLNEAIAEIQKGSFVEVEYFLSDVDGSGYGEYVEISGKVAELSSAFRYLKIEVENEYEFAKPEHIVVPLADISRIWVLA